MRARWLRRGSISNKLKSSLALSLMLMLQYTSEFYKVEKILWAMIRAHCMSINEKFADANRFQYLQSYYRSLTLFQTNV